MRLPPKQIEAFVLRAPHSPEVGARESSAALMKLKQRLEQRLGLELKQERETTRELEQERETTRETQVQPRTSEEQVQRSRRSQRLRPLLFRRAWSASLAWWAFELALSAA